MDKETRERIRKAYKEPFPRNLFITLAEDTWFNTQIPVDNITEDMVAGLDYAISLLPPRDQRIIRMRYAEKMTFAAIAKEFDVTSERIRTLEHRSLCNLRRPPLLGYIKYGKQAYEERIVKAREEKERIYKEDKYQIRIDKLDLSVRAENRLIAKGYVIVKDIVELTEDEIIQIKAFGKKSIVETALKLESIGVSGTAWSHFIPKNKGDR